MLLFGLLLAGCQSFSPFTGGGSDTAASGKNTAVEVASANPAPADARGPSTDPAVQSRQDLWAYVGSQLRWEDIDNDKVSYHVEWYRAHPTFVQAISEQAAPYLFHVVDAIEQRKLPMELALLPIVESAYDPLAYSPSKAAGMWQFMVGTGQEFGLFQNWWYDGRRDIVASTSGALLYLEQLNLRFSGDWLHTLAAYNSGPGRVKRAIRFNDKRGRNSDFWSLRLPRETHNYIPKLIALARIFSEPEAYGIELAVVPRQPYFRSVNTGGQIDLALVADLADIGIEEVYALNPGLSRWATDPDGAHKLQLPVAASLQFERELRDVPREERVTWSRYVIKPGDSLSRIAKLHKTSIELVQNINKLPSSFIKAGDTLLIPIGRPLDPHPDIVDG